MAAPKEIEDLVERFEQKKELREYKKKAKAQTQLPQVEPVPLTIEAVEVDLSQDQAQPKAIGQSL